MPKTYRQNFRIVIVDNGSTRRLRGFSSPAPPGRGDHSERLKPWLCRGDAMSASGMRLTAARITFSAAEQRCGGQTLRLSQSLLRSWRIIQLLVLLAPRSTTTMIHGRSGLPEGYGRKRRLRLRHRGANVLDEGQFDEKCEVGSVSGCSMLVRSAAILSIGLMEESYFLYWEDTEWCARAGELGYKVLFVPESRIWHKVSSWAGMSSFSQYYYFTRSGFFFLRQYDLLLMPVFVVYNLLVGLKCLASGNPQPLRGLAHGFIDFVQGKKGLRQSISVRSSAE